jgi:predicted Zn finger-like uncharacterized protein
MAMVTRCPACDTAFRVAPPQLQARNGMVRCGRCLTIFDGFKALSTMEDPAASEAAAAQASAEEPAAPHPDAEQLTAPGSGEMPQTPVEPAFKLEPVSATELAAAAASAPGPTAKSDGGDEMRDFGPAPQQLTLEDHLFLEETRAARARHARWWAAGAVLLVLALVAQAGYVYRGGLAAYFPAARPALVQWCAAVGCAINLPQRPRQISIEASDLQATDTARPGLIQLTATVRNHAGHDVGFPALDLVLTNSRDHTLARRVFQPRDYLEPGRDARAGIPASAEVTIHLELDTGDLNPVGFRLDLLAAPN